MELIPYKERIEGYTRKRLSILNQWRYFKHFKIHTLDRFYYNWEFFYQDVEPCELFDEHIRSVLVIHHDRTLLNFILLVLITPIFFLFGGIDGVREEWSSVGCGLKKGMYYYHEYHHLQLDDFMGYGKESSTWLHNLFLNTNLKTLKQNEDGYYVPKD